MESEVDNEGEEDSEEDDLEGEESEFEEELEKEACNFYTPNSLKKKCNCSTVLKLL